MFKKITQSILELNPEKALSKALEKINFSDIEQRKHLIDILSHHSEKLLNSESFLQLNDLLTLSEIALITNGELQSKARQKLGKLLSEEQLNNSTENHLNAKNLVLSVCENIKGNANNSSENSMNADNAKILFLLTSLCESEDICQIALKEIDIEQQKIILIESDNSICKVLVLSTINELDELKALEKLTKNKYKKTHRLLQEKIDSIEALEKTKNLLIEERDHILEAIEKLSKSSVVPLYDSKLQHLEQEWSLFPQKIKESPFDKTVLLPQASIDAFNTYSKNCQDQLDIIEQQEIAEFQKKQNISFLETALQKIKMFLSAPEIDLTACTVLVDSVKEKLQNCDPADLPKAFNQNTYHYYLDVLAFETKFSENNSDLANFDTVLSELDELFESNQKKKKASSDTIDSITQLSLNYKSLIIDYPKGDSQGKDDKIESGIYQKIKQKTEHVNKLRQKSNAMQVEFQTKFDKKTGYIKSEIDNKALGTVIRLCKEAEEIIPFCPQSQQEKLTARLNIHIEEKKALADWINSATLPKRKELCEAMEKLSQEAPKLKIKVIKESIQDLQQQWKSLGHARDKEGNALWKQFQELGNLAYQPVKDLVERKDSEKQDHLETRKKIVESLKKHLTSDVTTANDAEKLYRNSQSHWKRAFPVPAGNQNLQAEFDDLITTMLSKLEPQRKVNLGKKKTLLAEAQKLVALEDNSKAIDEAKSLQKQWKDIGYSEEDEKLWLAFREQCDEIFNRRDELKNEEKGKEKVAITQAKALCNAIESLNCETVNTFESELRKLTRQFEEIKDIPRQRKDIQGHFNSAKKAAKQSLKALKKEQESKTFEKIIELSEQLGAIEKNIIENNVNGDFYQNDISQAIDSFTGDKKVAQNFRTSIEQLASKKDKDREQYLEQQSSSLRTLCLSLEIELNIESPSSEKALRMELQVKRLNKKFNQGDNDLSNSEKILSAFYLGGIHSFQSPDILNRLIALNNKVV